MCHAHLFHCTHVWLLPVEYPLHQQSVQNPVNVPYSSSPVPHSLSRLHPGEPDEVPEVEVISLVMVPVISLAVHPLDQGVSSRIWTCVHGRAVGQARVCHPGHTSNGALAVATRHMVAVEVVAWHDELGG